MIKARSKITSMNRRMCGGLELVAAHVEGIGKVHDRAPRESGLKSQKSLDGIFEQPFHTHPFLFCFCLLYNFPKGCYTSPKCRIGLKSEDKR